MAGREGTGSGAAGIALGAGLGLVLCAGVFVALSLAFAPGGAGPGQNVVQSDAQTQVAGGEAPATPESSGAVPQADTAATIAAAADLAAPVTGADSQGAVAGLADTAQARPAANAAGNSQLGTPPPEPGATDSGTNMAAAETGSARPVSVAPGLAAPVADSPDVPVVVAATGGEQAAGPASSLADGGATAFDRYAAGFDSAPGLPVLAVLVMDPAPAQVAQLAEAGVPVTALLSSQAAGRAQINALRGAGAEAVAVLPMGWADAGLDEFLDRIDGAMAVAYDPDIDPVGDADLQVLVAALQQRGLGLIALGRSGSGRALRLARDGGLHIGALELSPALDAGPEDVRRRLERVALTVQQRGSGIVLLAADSAVAVLADWPVSRMGVFAIGPASTVMRVQSN